MEFLLGVVAFTGWYMAVLYWRKVRALSRLMQESISLTQTSINAQQALIKENMDTLSDLGRATIILGKHGYLGEYLNPKWAEDDSTPSSSVH